MEAVLVALLDFESTGKRWQDVITLHKSSVYALERRGLVSYNRYRGRVRLTDTGRSRAEELR